MVFICSPRASASLFPVSSQPSIMSQMKGFFSSFRARSMSSRFWASSCSAIWRDRTNRSVWGRGLAAEAASPFFPSDRMGRLAVLSRFPTRSSIADPPFPFHIS